MKHKPVTVRWLKLLLASTLQSVSHETAPLLLLSLYLSSYCISRIAGSEARPPDGRSVPGGIRGLHLFVVQRLGCVSVLSNNSSFLQRTLFTLPLTFTMLWLHAVFLFVCFPSSSSLSCTNVSSTLELIIDYLPFNSQAQGLVTFVTEHTCAKMHVWKRLTHTHTVRTYIHKGHLPWLH